MCDVDAGTAEAVAVEHDATPYTDDARMLDSESLDATEAVRTESAITR